MLLDVGEGGGQRKTYCNVYEYCKWQMKNTTQLHAAQVNGDGRSKRDDGKEKKKSSQENYLLNAKKKKFFCFAQRMMRRGVKPKISKCSTSNSTSIAIAAMAVVKVVKAEAFN